MIALKLTLPILMGCGPPLVRQLWRGYKLEIGNADVLGPPLSLLHVKQTNENKQTRGLVRYHGIESE